LTQLRYLDLSKSGVTDSGMAHMKGLTGFRSLILKTDRSISTLFTRG
jgi:hypothetical protein